MLNVAGIDDLFDVRVDGVLAEELGLAGKPDPAILVQAARRLTVRPERCVVIEDTEAGVTAGRDGGFALVIGVARNGNADDLLRCGADVVVADAADISVRPGRLSHRYVRISTATKLRHPGGSLTIARNGSQASTRDARTNGARLGA